MTKLVAINNQAHRELKVDPSKVEELGADMNMVPVVTSEFLKLVVHYPIVFTKSAETGKFVCVCLMGLEQGENLFWENARFNSIYTPLHITRQPFFVGQDDKSGNDYVVCIDEESPSISTSTGERLFHIDGTPSPFLNMSQEKLAQLIAGEQHTEQFIEALLQYELLVPLTLDITFEDSSTAKVNGLYSIDEDKLAALPDEAIISLKEQGLLQLIYTQQASMGQVYNLIDKRNQRGQQTSPWFKASGA